MLLLEHESYATCVVVDIIHIEVKWFANNGLSNPLKTFLIILLQFFIIVLGKNMVLISMKYYFVFLFRAWMLKDIAKLYLWLINVAP